VVCPDRSYHKLLHVRQSALAASGHADWRKCWRCKEYGPISEFDKNSNIHSACRRLYSRTRRRGL
jgi:hypothetical protein